MLKSRLELASAHGDQTIGDVKFVLVGTTVEQAQVLSERGLDFVEGRQVASTDFVFAGQQSGQPADAGVVAVVAVPSDCYVGHAVFTTAYVVRATKLVMGAPIAYAAARQHLAIYMDRDTERVRQHVEAQVASGVALGLQPTVRVDPRYLMGAFRPKLGLANLAQGLQVSAQAFEAIDYDRLEAGLAQLFVCREPAQAVLVPSMIHGLVVAMVEAAVMSHVLARPGTLGLSLPGGQGRCCYSSPHRHGGASEAVG